MRLTGFPLFGAIPEPEKLKKDDRITQREWLALHGSNATLAQMRTEETALKVTANIPDHQMIWTEVLDGRYQGQGWPVQYNELTKPDPAERYHDSPYFNHRRYYLKQD